MNIINVLIVELRESIRPAIPQIIALHSSEEVEEALLKFLEQGKPSKASNFLHFADVPVDEFQESIIHAIPQIIYPLIYTGRHILLKLSGQGRVLNFLICMLLM